jgi:hypothetical protein
MESERGISSPAEGRGATRCRIQPEGTSKRAKTPELVVPEAARPPPEERTVVQVLEIVDVAKLEAERRERQRARKREYVRRLYHETKQAALAGDADAQQRWQRKQAQNREGQRRWRARHPEQSEANQRAYRQRKKLEAQQPFDAPIDRDDKRE